MRRTLIPILVAVIAFGLGAGTAQAAKAKKVSSQIEIEWYGGSSEGPSLFGDVHSKKNKCERNRKVTLEAGGNLVGTGSTDRTGDWSIRADLDFDEPFVASVEKRKIGSGDRKLVCKAAESPPIIFEA
jgi:hypothetical protein